MKSVRSRSPRSGAGLHAPVGLRQQSGIRSGCEKWLWNAGIDCGHARLLVAALVESEEEFLNLLATCVGETGILTDNHESTFF